MNQELPRRIAGNIYIDGELKKGTAVFSEGSMEFTDSIHNDAVQGTLIPGLINAHTHIGDSFVRDVPFGSIPEIVGPGGFKDRTLASASDEELLQGMRWAQEIILNSGTVSFMDFRESGLHGVELLKSLSGEVPRPIILGRSDAGDGADSVLRISSGLGLSAISDHDFDDILSAREEAGRQGKIFAIHFSENLREDIEKIVQLRPDFIVHGIAANDHDLDIISEEKIPLAITPRSNIFYGKRPDYSRFLRHGIKLMLGTDNVMATTPDIFAEMHFLHLYQRGIDPFGAKEILKMVTVNPRDFLSNFSDCIPPHMVFFPNNLLSEQDIVTRGNYFQRKLLKFP